jgi:WD repeat-containing protein 68
MLPRTQLIAHDKEVYDIAFACGKDIFGTVGADGSLRMFDLRSLEHSTILYETPDLSPLMRLVWNKQDPNYIATILTEANKTVVIDVRMPTYPVAELIGHTGAINGLAWAPHSSNHICTVGDDYQALIWDTSMKNVLIEDPILAFSAQSEINSLQWCASHEDWVAISFKDCLQILKV